MDSFELDKSHEMTNNNKPMGYNLENDEEARKPFLGDDKTRSSTLDSTSPQPDGNLEGTLLTKRKKIFLASLVAILLLVVLVVCVVLTQGKRFFSRDVAVSEPGRKFSLDDVLNGEYSYQSFSADWVSDESFLHISDNVIEQSNLDTEHVTTIMSAREVAESHYPSVMVMSPDKEWFLFANSTTSLYRHSFYADYYIKNLKTNVIRKVAPPNGDKEQIRHCAWGSVGNALVFVHKCNIYYISSVSGNLVYDKITRNGVPKKVFNGVPDWVYEEEIIASTHALEFSSKGKYMAYVTFNATLVPFYRFPFYGEQSNMYPSIEKIAYPKAGFSNPTIKITIVDLELTLRQGRVSKSSLVPPTELSSSDYYYAVMKFNHNEKKEDEVFIQWMNRRQNKTICMLYRFAADGLSEGKVVERHEVANGWIDDDYQTPKFANDGSYYITMLAGPPVAGRGRFRHLAKVSVADPKVEFLTSGPFTVQDINCWNPDEQMVYFRSTEVSPRVRHIYSYNVTSNEKKCITCDGLITDRDGTKCTVYAPGFSTKCSWMTLVCVGPFLPLSYMIGLKSGKKLLLEANNRTRHLLEQKDIPQEVFYSIKSDGYDIPVKETRPIPFDKKKKYPVLFDVYGGPNTQKVTEDYRKVRFDTYFVSSHDIILVEFDARGSGYYGYDFLYAVYRNLGHYEAIDAVAVAKHLQSLPYVDRDRIAIWGWSYGGFFAATALAESRGVINTAVAVAPVTDWRYYDTVYSERYMGFPSKEDNLDGYKKTSVMYKAEKFAGKNFLLIHGTADDNVHFQNSVQLANALIYAGVKFRSQFYTDRDHSIQSGGHIQRLIADYLVAKLKGTPPKGRLYGV